MPGTQLQAVLDHWRAQVDAEPALAARAAWEALEVHAAEHAEWLEEWPGDEDWAALRRAWPVLESLAGEHPEIAEVVERWKVFVVDAP